MTKVSTTAHKAQKRDILDGVEDTNDIMCVGQRVRLMEDNGESLIQVDPERVVEELGEIAFDKATAGRRLL